MMATVRGFQISFASDGGMVLITDDGVSYSPPPTAEQRAAERERMQQILDEIGTPGTIEINGRWVGADDPDHG